MALRALYTIGILRQNDGAPDDVVALTFSRRCSTLNIVMLLLMPPLLFVPGDHAVAATTSIRGVIVGISKLMSLDRRESCVYSLSVVHA